MSKLFKSDEYQESDVVDELFETQVPTPKDPGTIPDRLSVVETIYHQSHTEEPFALEQRYFRELKTKEQPYYRHCKIGEAWEPIDTGWIGNHPGLLYIFNEEGKFPYTLPTQEQKEESDKKIIEIGFDASANQVPPPNWKILPRESFRGCPSTLEGLFIRSLSGIIKYSLCLYPE